MKRFLAAISLAFLGGCEIVSQQSYNIMPVGKLDDTQELCNLLGEASRPFGLKPRNNDGEGVLCLFIEDESGFPLYVGARRENGIVQVNFFAWNRVEEYEALSSAVLPKLLDRYPEMKATPPDS